MKGIFAHLFSCCWIPILGLSITYSANTNAAEPCPWQDTEHSALCSEWDRLQERLESAEQRARDAEKALGLEQDAATVEANENESDSTKPAETIQKIAADDPQTAQVRSTIDGFIKVLENPSYGFVPGHFEVNSDYTLDRSDDAYVARLNEAQLHLDADDVVINFAPVVLTLQPMTDDLTSLSLRINDEISGSENGEKLFTINISEHEINGIWSNETRTFSDLNVRVDGLHNHVVGQGSMTIDQLSLNQALSVAEDEQWQQRINIRLKDVHIDANQGSGAVITLAGADTMLVVSGIFFNRLIMAKEEMQAQSASAIGSDVDKAESLLFDALVGTVSDYSISLSLSELDIANRDGKLATIETIGLASGFESENELGRLTHMLELQNVLGQSSQLPESVVPQDIRLEFSFSNIPAGSLHHLIDSARTAQKLNENERDVYMMQQLSPLWLNSGLRLDIVNTFIDMASSRIDLSAQAKFQPEATFGGSGKLRLQVQNLQNILDGTGVSQLEALAPYLAIIAAFSDRTDENGYILDTFELVLQDNGQVMLNGKDITALIKPQTKAM